jgi:phage terminase large subunit
LSGSLIRLPNNWRPRPYQLKAWQYLEHGGKRAVLCWHRRSGKDEIALHHSASQMVQRPGNYWHMLPQANQARKAIWEAINPHTGKKRIDEAFPVELRETTRDHEMLIRFRPTSMSAASTWQVVGSDNYNALIGSPPIGVVYSEYALSDPNSWAFLRPILAENGGWAAFISTPRGRNHFARMLKMAQAEPGWFGQVLTVADTGVISPEIIAQERRELAAERGDDEAENIVQQEYYCNLDAAIPGSYYGKLIAKAEADGRIGHVPYNPNLAVITAWDLGVGDSTAIWFIQQEHSGAVKIIDYYENSGVGADHYARILKERDYWYDGHILPHDADDREWGNNATSRVASLKGLGIKPCRVLPNASIDDGINAVRVLLPRCYFDAGKCERGIDALRQYQKLWDDKLRTFKDSPLHDWTSHGADAFRYLAQGLKAVRGETNARPKYAVT